ncbi:MULTISPECIES: tungstate ABC transporter substrate-binding protein WtpA [unclassified Haladaptatus]|uniref:tungstate ABC transporter substrate-binding protein WtpA n=1 Tax=unclassified Haladaptatus TaxID=2622732 RepID=UPI00209BD310|nr:MULTISPECIES: tungstate ABC transporter substrate-binding protein WtpA [unclassified Haladaptatus]MCO8246526.1 tungstate ABC transporter substrate-binding protein WtpA [Haladaptatus sp. AB643]MCO8254764.1 tungstate ABC transporter substrate-binding protein WtpA [Haladaptatus sp. AB618]
MGNRPTITRRRLLRGVGTTGVLALAGCTSSDDGGDGGGDRSTSSGETDSTDGGTSSEETTSSDLKGFSGTMTIFHAGSLSAPFDAAEKKVESNYDVQVNQEAKGSVDSTRKITNLGRSADVLGVADYRLLRDMMLPKHAKWYAVFATNAMTIAYTDKSTGADEISADNWWKILGRDDVTFGHSDPAADPNGYRSVMSMKLGAIPLDGEKLFDESTSKKLIDKSKVPSSTETDLLSQLHSGDLDYAWEYQSTSASHDVKTVDLQPSVDLSKATKKYAEHYAKVSVKTDSATYTGAPIAYGMTVPTNAKNTEAGNAWVEYMITEPGGKILKDNGFKPVSPAVVPKSQKDAVPETIMNDAEAKSALGPLKL